MATVDLLRLFVSLLEEADRSGPRGDVVPVLLHEISENRNLIRAVARHAGVVVHDAAENGSPLEKGVEGDPDSEICKLIRHEFSDVGVDIVDRDGLIVAVQPDSGTQASPGVKNFLGLLTALCDRRLTQYRFVVVIYDETNMVVANRARLLKFLAQTIPASKIPIPTIIAVIGNSASEIADRHFQKDGSVRHVVFPSKVSHRHRWSVSDRDIARLADPNTPLVLFLGAGACRSAGLPLGDELRNQALHDFLPQVDPVDPDDIEPYMEAFFHWVVDQGRLLPEETHLTEAAFRDRLTLERVLREEGFDSASEGPGPTLTWLAQRELEALNNPGPAMLALRQIIQLHPRLAILTVNFDRLVETASPGADLDVLIREEDYAGAATRLRAHLSDGSGPTPVIKMHGSIEDHGSIVATVERTAQGLSADKSEVLRALAGPASEPYKWVYVGYSMRDPDISAELQLPFFAERVDERWVMPILDASLDSFERVRRSHWLESDSPTEIYQRAITETADVFFTTLLDRLRSFTG